MAAEKSLFRSPFIYRMSDFDFDPSAKQTKPAITPEEKAKAQVDLEKPLDEIIAEQIKERRAKES